MEATNGWRGMYLATEFDINLRNAASGHGGCGVETAKLLDELWCERWIFLQVCKLGGVFEEFHNALLNTKIERLSDCP